MKPSEIEDLLTPTETPEPPEGLLEAIRSEIPAELPRIVSPEGDRHAGGVLPFGKSRSLSRRTLLAAATLAVALLGGFLAWRVSQEPGHELGRPLGQRNVASEATQVSEPPARPSAPVAGQNGDQEAEAIGTATRAKPLDPPRNGAPPADRTEAEIDLGQEMNVLLDERTREAEAAPTEALGDGDEASLSALGYLGREGTGERRADDARAGDPANSGARSLTEAAAGPEADPASGAAADSPSDARADRGRFETRAAPSPAPVQAEPPPVRAEVMAPPPPPAPRGEAAELRKVPIPDPTPDEPKASHSNQQVERVNRQIARMEAEQRKLEEELRQLEEGETQLRDATGTGVIPPPSTGGTAEPNAEPYGDTFYRDYGVNPFVDTAEDPLSTFALDVDTGSYAVARRYLLDGHLPPPEAIRVEEFVNSFAYGDPPPRSRGRMADFALHAEGAPSPFAPPEGAIAAGTADRYRLLRLAIRGRDIAAEDRKPADLVFVVDVSGSMARENRLGLVQQALLLLLGELRPDDRVGLVVYGSRGRVVLEPTGDRRRLRSAILALRPESSTNVEEGLRLAYELARRHAREGATHRLILCSDGVANVGNTSAESILAAVRRGRNDGIELTTAGFGMGNYNDVLMEQLADQGDGRYAYVDDLTEAHRLFVEDLTGTLQTLAFDAKAQLELDPALVERWRLLGYENRDVADERFRDDRVDAGEIGAGHTVTALYELRLAPDAPLAADTALGALRLRYRSATSGEIVELERRVTGRDLAPSWEAASPALRLAAVVAEFAEVLRGSYWARGGAGEAGASGGDARAPGLRALSLRARQVAEEHPGDARVAELASLVRTAARLLDSGPR